MSEFITKISTSGVETAYHRTSGVLVHSDIDPLSEALSSARMLCQQNTKSVLLIGHGFGYLYDALRRFGVECTSIELFAGLHSLAGKAKSTQQTKLILSRDSLAATVRMSAPDARIIIASYIMALRRELSEDLADYLDLLHVMQQSQQVYAPTIQYNVQRNLPHLNELTRFVAADHASEKFAIAIGAGPTLSMCLDTLKEWRQHIILVSASGASSILSGHGLVPDWIIAMEARNTIVRDMDSTEKDSKVLVFPWTHPDVLNNTYFNRVLANDSDYFATDGGSSGLVAADLCARISSSAIFMLGMDMSDTRGEYSEGGNRTTANVPLHSPKFSVMRAAVCEWRQKLASREVYHIVTPGTPEVAGTIRLYPAELSIALARCRNSLAAVGERLA